MTEAVLDIKQWGNNLGVRLPAAVAREAHLHADQRVRVSIEGGQVVIRPLTDVHLTLEQRLARFDPARHAGEVMTAGRRSVMFSVTSPSPSTGVCAAPRSIR